MPRGQCKKLDIKNPDDFWKYVETGESDSCWEWQAGKTTQGYGVFYLPGLVRKYTHRYAYEVTTGAILTPDMKIMHKCDNPPCCNPSHLILGTQMDNMRDKIAKGRARNLKGSEHTNSKLNEFQVSAIRRMYAGGECKQADLAVMFGVSQSVVSNIISGKTWKHVA
jgi:hypothetical protein